MWLLKFFKKESDAKKWMKAKSQKFQIGDLVFVENGFAVEYRKLRKIY